MLQTAGDHTCDLNNSHALVSSGLQINVVGTNTSCHDELQVLGLLQLLLCHVCWVEGSGDQDVGIPQMLLQLCNRGQSLLWYMQFSHAHML